MDTLDNSSQSSSGWAPPKKAPRTRHGKLNLPLLDLPSPETDTLIYLTPISAPSPPLRCSSQKLLATGSPVFEKLLGPTSQFRLLRRKNLLKHGLPMGIKFVIDLSPPEEGDEAVAMIEKLWCPDEILLWTSNLEGYVEPDEEHLPTNKKKDGEIKTPDADTCPSSPKRIPSTPSYSPTRHTAAIERVLHILHGLDPRIHTTPMWYTVHKVAVQLQCTSAVQDHILSWLYGNLDFVESYPALVLRIAAEVQNQTLFRDAFALLVGAQLLCDNAGTSPPDGKVPEEAEPWRKNILFARQSLHLRLKQMYEYMLSTAWLDNETAIPEYAKLMSRLNDHTVPLHLQALTHELDHAIRADMKVALVKLFALSQDPTSPSYMPPHERQIYSRAYWLEMQSSAHRAPLFGEHVVTLLLGWEGNARRVARERKQESEIDPQIEGILQNWENMGYPLGQAGDSSGTTSTQSVREVQEEFWDRYSRGKVEDAFTAPKRAPQLFRSQTYKWLSDALATKHPRNTDNLGGIVGSNPLQADENSSSRSIGLPTTLLESANVPANIPPPLSYDATNYVLPCCAENPLSLTTLETSTYLLSPSQAKRKSCGDPGSRLNSISNSEHKVGDEEVDENTSENCAVEMHEMTTARVLSRSERIEIINPISKRRCSVDSDGGDDQGASLKTHAEQVDKMQTGEPEMFSISGVYETLAGGGAQEEEDENMIRRTEETAIKVTQVARIDREFQDAVDNVIADTRPVPADLAAYGNVEDVRAIQTQHENEDTLFNTKVPRKEEQQKEEELEYDIEAYIFPTEYDTDYSVASRHLLDEPTPCKLSVQPLNWRPLADRAKLDTAGTGEGSGIQQLVPQQTIDALGAFFGDTNTPPITYHTFATPCPYTSIQEPTLANKNQVNTRVLWKQCLSHLKVLSAEALKVPISFTPALGGGLVLVCLGDEEWQFMPLWAGGLDDGSGGVFGEFVAPPPPDSGENDTKIELEQEQERRRGEGEETEVESLLGSYDDCMDLESVGSFETSGFSEFETGGSTAEWSELGDSEVDEGQSDVETREESEVESLEGSTAEEDDSGSDEGFEDFGWEST